MKGVIFNIFESFVNKNLGEKAWLEILEDSKMGDDVFVGPKTYEDSKFIKILTSCLTIHKLPLQGAVRSFGKFTFPQLVSKAPELVAQYKTPEDLLLNLDGIIHVEVRKLMENANPPKFKVTCDADKTLTMVYESERKFCYLVEGLLEGVADHFGKTVKYHQSSCVHEGASSCIFKVSFLNKGEGNE